jgi:hypothetical protein
VAFIMVNILSFWFVLMSCFDFSNSLKFLSSCGVETLSDPCSPANCHLTSATCHIITKHTHCFLHPSQSLLLFILLFYNSTNNSAGSQVYIHDFEAIDCFEGACNGTVG